MQLCAANTTGGDGALAEAVERLCVVMVCCGAALSTRVSVGSGTGAHCENCARDCWSESDDVVGSEHQRHTGEHVVVQTHGRLHCLDSSRRHTGEITLPSSTITQGLSVRRRASPRTWGPPGWLGGDPPAGNASHGRTPPSGPHDLKGRADPTSPWPLVFICNTQARERAYRVRDTQETPLQRSTGDRACHRAKQTQ